MKNLGKIIFFVIILVFPLFIFSSSLLQAAHKTSDSSDTIKLTFWNFWDPKFILPVIERFEKENPGVKIINEQVSWSNGLDKIVISMANNMAPDICEMGSTWMGKFMSEGALLDITDKVSDLKDEYLMWAPAQMNGRYYGMPWLAGTRVMFYNRELFAQAGLDPDKPPLTWKDFLDAARLIHNPKKGIYGFGMNAGEGHILYKKFMPFVWGNGGKILDENDNFVFDSQETREALDFYLKLKEYSYCEKQDLLDEAFKRGKLGLAISGSWNFARYPKDAPNLDFGVSLMPKPAEEKGFSTSFLGGEILVLFKTCKNPDVAAKFIRYIVKMENTMPITKEAWVSFPAHLDAYKDSVFTQDKRLSVFTEQMKTAIHPPIHNLWIDLEKIINTAVEKAMYNEPIDSVFKEANEEFEKISGKKNESKQSSSFLIVILSALGVGIIINAILLAFILYEVKKNKSGPIGPIERAQRYILFLAPWFITFFIFWLYPLLFSVVLSFCEYDVFHPAVFSFSGFKNYMALVEDEVFIQSFFNTLIFVVGTTPVTTALGLALALMINSLKSKSDIFRSVFFLPSIISIVVTATIFKSFYSPVGLLNRFLALFGIQGYGWLVDKSFALPAIMIMDIWAYAGYYMVLYLAALTAVPKSLYDAAEIDGANEWEQFRYITLPQIKYMTVFVMTINTIRSWQVFPEVFTLTSGGPVGSTNTLVHHLYELAFRYHKMGYASAISLVLLLLVFLFSFIQMKILSGKKR